MTNDHRCMPIFHKDWHWGLGVNMFTTNPAKAVTYSNVTDNTQQGPVARESSSCVMERMNSIPLYGAATHPLHLKLCMFEQTFEHFLANVRHLTWISIITSSTCDP